MLACARCHRVLKDPVSVERGFGPVCWAKQQALDASKQTEQYDGPYDGGDIILERRNGIAHINVPKERRAAECR